MRTIGLVGGLSWESTAVYYRLLNERVRDGSDVPYRQPVVLLHSVDFAQIVSMQQSGDWEAAGEAMAAAALSVVRGGADVVGMCANTMHLVADAVAQALPPGTQLVSVIDATAGAFRTAGLWSVGLLGTAYTMEQPFYAEGLRDHGLEVRTPTAADRAQAHRIVYDELVRGVVIEESRRWYADLVERMSAEGCAGIALACTELGMLRLAELTDVPLIDTTSVHVDALLRAASPG